MWRAKGTTGQQARRLHQQSRHGMDRPGRNGFVEAWCSQEIWDAPREQCLARSRRADEAEIVSSGGGHFESTSRDELGIHLGHVGHLTVCRLCKDRYDRPCSGRRPDGEDLERVSEFIRRADLEAWHDRCFQGVRGGKHQADDRTRCRAMREQGTHPRFARRRAWRH